MEKTFMDNIDRTIFPYVEYPGYPFRYPTHLPLIMERSQVKNLRDVSRGLFGIFAKAVKRFQEMPDAFFDAMEIPPKMKKYLHQGNLYHDFPTWISRFDYVIDKNTGRIQMVEINADTPCAEIEAYYANGVAADYFKKEDPNAYEQDRLRRFLMDIFIRVTGRMSAAELHEHPFLFSCFHDYIEDYGTTLYLMNTLKKAVDPSVADDIVFESFYNLAVMPDGSLALPDGRTPCFLYRMHPMEILIEEQADEDGSSLGELMMDGYLSGKFAMMNPPECIIMQSKGFQALVYALMEEHRFFTDKEQDLIRTYLPESYFQRDFRLGDQPEDSEWIRKPIWGREGHGIDIIDGRGQRIKKKEGVYEGDIVFRESDGTLVQRFVPQEKIVTKTDVGIEEGYITLSCFMLGDTPSAIYARFSPDDIAGTEAYWIPVLY